MALLQLSSFVDFTGWLFGIVFCALVGLFWFWVSRSVAELKEELSSINDRINTIEKNNVRMEEQLHTLRDDLAKTANSQRIFLGELQDSVNLRNKNK